MSTTTPNVSSSDLAERTADLLAATRSLLAADDRASSLGAALPEIDDSPLRIALAGPHNAGKSMLVAALLDLDQDAVDEITAPIPLTAEATPYPWEGHLLLDLPGTQAGLEDHDTVAAAGVRSADLLLLVTSVELPGEDETRQIRRLLGDQGFARRVLLVINKCNSEESDLEVIRSEMLRRIDDFPWISPVFADARDYVRSRNAEGLSDEDRALYREESRMDEVTATLHELTDRGVPARLLGWCHQVRRTSDEAHRAWEPDFAEEARNLAADQISAAVANARTELADATELALSTLHSTITSIGDELAAAVSEEDGSLAKSRVTEASAAEKRAEDQFLKSVNAASERALRRLDEQLDLTLVAWDRYSAESGGPAIRVKGGQGDRKGMVGEMLDRAWDAGLGKAREKLSAFVDGGVREGTPAHNLAKKLNSAMRKDVKPYTHQNKAKQLTKAGKRVQAAAEFVGPVVDVKGILDTLKRGQQIKKKREEIRSSYVDHADDTRSRYEQTLAAHVEDNLRPRLDAVDQTLSESAESARTRAEAQMRWREQRDRALVLAAEIDHVLAQAAPPVHGED